MARKRFTVYLPPDLQSRVERLSKDQHRSESSVITTAVKAQLNRAEVEKEEPASRRDIARLDIRLDKAIGEQLILKEVLLIFVRLWLEHNPPVPEDLEDAAAASAEARFEHFLDIVAHALSPGQSVATRELKASFSVNGRALNGAEAQS